MVSRSKSASDHHDAAGYRVRIPYIVETLSGPCLDIELVVSKYFS
jgi:hypothetical protein